MILGGGALNAAAAATRIAEKLNAPVFTTTAGKGAIRGDHPLCLRLAALGDPGTMEFLKTCDAILCVGSELSETDFWDTTAIIEKNLIRIDIDPGSLARPHTAEIAILGDARAALEMLEPMLSAARRCCRGIPAGCSVIGCRARHDRQGARRHSRSAAPKTPSSPPT